MITIILFESQSGEDIWGFYWYWVFIWARFIISAFPLVLWQKLCYKLWFFNSSFFPNWTRRSNTLSLKDQKFRPSGCTDVEFRVYCINSGPLARGVVRNLSMGGGAYFFFLFRGGTQHLMGPENLLKSIDFPVKSLQICLQCNST